MTWCLGQFFAVWGAPLSPTQLGLYKAKGDRRFECGSTASPRGALDLKDDQQIVVAYGTPRQLADAVSR